MCQRTNDLIEYVHDHPGCPQREAIAETGWWETSSQNGLRVLEEAVAAGRLIRFGPGHTYNVTGGSRYENVRILYLPSQMDAA